ncbi:Uncharacterised protein [Vibrio cholerae]|nr:Uncharacterised protein [Vibrio cholerae]CSB32018.1 Uncharacterised protein [Vibrio cholerae]CSB37975.1 Uncharacterised protein [Vibrio cholerae]CSB55925.1 Uncharacterised protein [Vibrio cholerae]CSB92353.1 Uncharacterised protein [Vibrio cholerae]
MLHFTQSHQLRFSLGMDLLGVRREAFDDVLYHQLIFIEVFTVMRQPVSQFHILRRISSPTNRAR